MIGGRQFWSLLAILAILLGLLLIVGHPKESPVPVSPPPPEDNVKVIVLNYHMINSRFLSLAVEPSDFDWQMKYLVDHGYHTISPNELYEYLAGTGSLPAALIPQALRGYGHPAAPAKPHVSLYATQS